MLAKGSFPWITGAVAFTVVTGLLSNRFSGPDGMLFTGLFLLGAVLTAFFFMFFRDPERIPRGDEDDMISPADGKVISIRNRTLSIFMNIHNVHVNRAPLSGRVTQIDYKPGGFIPAFNKDSEANERNHIIIGSEYGALEVTQIAGALTRRIVSYISEGIQVSRGERIGLICFGSRVDIVIPEDYEFTIGVGDNVKACLTIIAMMRKKLRG